MQSRPISVVLIPPERWQNERDAWRPGEGPDPWLIYREMERHGVAVELMDPAALTLRLLRGANPFYTGFDPLRALRVLALRRRVDMVLSVFDSSAALPLLLRGPARFRPRIALWDITPNELWRPRRLLQRWLLPRCDHVFVLSRFHADWLARPGRVSVVGQHVDADFFHPAPPAPDGPTDGPVLAIGEDVGRDFALFLDAVAPLDIDVIVKTRRPLALPGGRARITRIAGRLSFVELRRLYAQARLVVVPLRETLNVAGVGSMLEAMAMARPLIVSDNPPIRDFVIPGQTALVVPPGDGAALRAAIAGLLADPARAAALAQSGRAFVAAHFAKPVFARRMADAIRMVVEGRGGPSG